MKQKEFTQHHFLSKTILKKNGAGFTLIELLVVIAVIGLLASVAMVALNSARIKARDARRLADIVQFQKALELYYDANGQYPDSGGAASPNASWSNSADSSWTTLQSLLSPYLAKLPNDPKPTGDGWAPSFGYAYFSLNYGCGQQWYMMVYTLENASGPDNGVRACDGTFFQYGGAGANTVTKTVGNRAK